MNFKSFITLASLVLLSLGGFASFAAQAATQAPNPLIVGLASTPTSAACAAVPVLDVDESVQTDKPTITAAAAQQIAETHVQTGCARQIKLDEEDCRLVYKIKIGNVKVKVDARTGAIIDTDYD